MRFQRLQLCSIERSLPEVFTTFTKMYKAFDNHGASDGVNLILGTPTNATPITIGSLTLSDLSNNGIGTLNVIAYDTVPFAHHTITTLNDLGLTSLTVSGTGDLAIGAFTDNVKTLTLTDNSTSTYGLSFTSSITAPNLTTLNTGRLRQCRRFHLHWITCSGNTNSIHNK